MPDEHKNGNGKGKWITIVTSLLSFIAATVFGAYVLGQRTGKVSELVDWKNETAPRIERMDGQGTLSFKLFHEEYLRTQTRQEEKLKELERTIHEKEMEDLKSRLQTLERKP